MRKIAQWPSVHRLAAALIIVAMFQATETRASDKLLSVSRHGSNTPEDELAGLPGLRLLFGSETQDGVHLNEKLVKDLTGGFKCFRRQVLEAIDLTRVRSDGSHKCALVHRPMTSVSSTVSLRMSKALRIGR